MPLIFGPHGAVDGVDPDGHESYTHILHECGHDSIHRWLGNFDIMTADGDNCHIVDRGSGDGNQRIGSPR